LEKIEKIQAKITAYDLSEINKVFISLIPPLLSPATPFNFLPTTDEKKN
jgi:hypothetical protein